MNISAGQTALITGASSGIGAAFARALAARGLHLILVARSEEKLRQFATQLTEQYSIRTEVIKADLSRPEAAGEVFAMTQQRGLSVDLLINNAGFGTHGRFETIDPERERQEVMLNIAAVVDLTHRFLPSMLASNNGTIINVASTAAFQPTPYMAVYGASKAFVLSFSEALWAEYRDKGIRVMALCPGATATEFFNVVGSEEAAIGAKETPEKVVRVALRALQQGRPSVVSGRQNTLLATMPRFLPRSLMARLAGRTIQPHEHTAQ